MRQTIVTLSFLIATQQESWKAAVKKWYRFLFHAITYGLFLLILFLRIYRGQHTLYDAGLGIAIGTLMFWIPTVVAHDVIYRKARIMYVRDLTMPVLTYILTIFLFTQHTIHWLGFGAAVLLILGGINFWQHVAME